MKYKLGAVIPTVQYGNIQPEIELEGDNFEELKAQAEAIIEEVWQKYSEKPLVKLETPTERSEPTVYTRLTTFTGEEIMYDAVGHSYLDMAGNKLMSGSVYADKHSPKFNKGVMIPKTAKAWKVDEKDLGSLWEMNGEVSTAYGNSIHKALEIWHKFSKMGAQIQADKESEENYCLPKNPHIRDIVKSFDELYGTDAFSEVLVSDVANGMAGQIDRLQVIDLDKKICRVGDYKTNNDLDDKKIKKYQLQLSFYANILINKGWTVRGLDIYHWSDHWEKVEMEVLPLV